MYSPHEPSTVHQSLVKPSSIVAPHRELQVHPYGVEVSGSAISLTSRVILGGSSTPLNGQPEKRINQNSIRLSDTKFEINA